MLQVNFCREMGNHYIFSSAIIHTMISIATDLCKDCPMILAITAPIGFLAGFMLSSLLQLDYLTSCFVIFILTMFGGILLVSAILTVFVLIGSTE